MRTLWGSYIAFSPSTANFVSYGGQIKKQSFSGSVTTDISNSLYRSPYTLLGLNLISLGDSAAISFETELDDAFRCEVSASRKINDFSMVYIVVGVPVKQICSCSGYIPYEKTCVTQCPAEYGQKAFNDGGMACEKGVNTVTTTTTIHKTTTTSTTISTGKTATSTTTNQAIAGASSAASTSSSSSSSLSDS